MAWHKKQRVLLQQWDWTKKGGADKSGGEWTARQVSLKWQKLLVRNLSREQWSRKYLVKGKVSRDCRSFFWYPHNGGHYTETCFTFKFFFNKLPIVKVKKIASEYLYYWSKVEFPFWLRRHSVCVTLTTWMPFHFSVVVHSCWLLGYCVSVVVDYSDTVSA